MSTSQNKPFDEESFHCGRDGERAFMSFVRSKGMISVEVGALREKLGEGAPMIYLPGTYLGKTKLVSPDFLTINALATLSGKAFPWTDKRFIWTAENMWDFPSLWNEVKTKNGCTFSRKLQCWQTGIDGYLLRHYLIVQHQTRIPLILFFLQVGTSTAQKNVPFKAGLCPTGIYACPVSWLPDATFPPKTPVKICKMAYWNIDKLIYLGPAEELAPSNSKAVRHINLCPSISDGIRKASSPIYESGNYTSRQILEPIALTPMDTTAIENMYYKLSLQQQWLWQE